MLDTAKHLRECTYLCYGFQKPDRINLKIACGMGNGSLPFSQHVRHVLEIALSTIVPSHIL